MHRSCAQFRKIGNQERANQIFQTRYKKTGTQGECKNAEPAMQMARYVCHHFFTVRRGAAKRKQTKRPEQHKKCTKRSLGDPAFVETRKSFRKEKNKKSEHPQDGQEKRRWKEAQIAMRNNREKTSQTPKNRQDANARRLAKKKNRHTKRVRTSWIAIPVVLS